MVEEDVTREEMLDEIAAILKPPEPPEDAFTAIDIYKRWGITKDAAAHRLQRDPRVERVGIFDNMAYYRIKKDDD
jgi:hypothetical protein